MNRKIQLFFLMTLCVLMFTACGKQKVTYNDDFTETDTAETTEKSVQHGLGNALGVENGYRWKDTLEGNNNKALEIDALVTYPEVENVCTVKVDKVYFTNEDKKRITDYFFDENTVRANTDITTKEDLQKVRENLQQMNEEGRRDVYASENVYKTYLNYIDYQMQNVPSKGEATEKIHDYEENSYIGSKNEVEYTVDFSNDKDINTSAFIVKRVQELGKFTEFYGNLNSSQNKCELSVEDAEKQALEIIKDLELPAMKMTGVNDLCQWYVNKADYERRDVNGYYFHFARDIEGIAVDNTQYYADNKRVLPLEDIPYFREFVDIGIDDKGLVFLNCAGMLTEGEKETVNHVLPFDNIKKIISEELTTYKEGEIKEVSLVYLRVGDSSTTDTFHYIPAWRVSPYYIDNANYVAYEALIWINAIDGSILDGKEDSVITNYNQFVEEDRLSSLSERLVLGWIPYAN